MTKMTYVEALNIALSTVTDTEAREKLEALRAQIEKRNATKSDKPTKKQVENAELKTVVLAALPAVADACTVTELMARDERLSALSNQKVSALVNALVRDGEAVKVPDKRVNRFARA